MRVEQSVSIHAYGSVTAANAAARSSIALDRLGYWDPAFASCGPADRLFRGRSADGTVAVSTRSDLWLASRGRVTLALPMRSQLRF
jgi:hypothetical protein